MLKSINICLFGWIFCRISKNRFRGQSRAALGSNQPAIVNTLGVTALFGGQLKTSSTVNWEIFAMNLYLSICSVQSLKLVVFNVHI